MNMDFNELKNQTQNLLTPGEWKKEVPYTHILSGIGYAILALAQAIKEASQKET